MYYYVSRKIGTKSNEFDEFDNFQYLYSIPSEIPDEMKFMLYCDFLNANENDEFFFHKNKIICLYKCLIILNV